VIEHATALADAIEAALPGWVERSVRRHWPDAPADLVTTAAAACVGDIGGRVRSLLAADVDEQRTTPLTLLREAVVYPAAVLREGGIPPVERDDFSRSRLPDDDYDLAPASFADVDPALHELGLVWGAAKAWTHKERHR
jgi:hypothetical protein